MRDTSTEAPTPDAEKDVIVLLSGGIDSATCLALACERHWMVAPVHIQYGQQTAALEERMARLQRDHIAEEYPETPIAPVEVIDYRDVFKPFAEGVASSESTFDHQTEADGRSSGYVPMRNLHFIATAAGLADAWGYDALYHGAQAGDGSDYPDCRPAFMDAATDAISESVPDGQSIELRTPLIHDTKAEVLERAAKLGVAFEYAYSCYRHTEVDDPQPCGNCPACLERAEAFATAGLDDPFGTLEVADD